MLTGILMLYITFLPARCDVTTIPDLSFVSDVRPPIVLEIPATQKKNKLF